MIDPTQQSPFPVTSRYHGISTSTLVLANGRKVVYLQRRFVPPSERFALLVEHTVEEQERLDTIAAQYLDDPEAFWRIADANNAIDPHELTNTPGRRLRITLPEGIPGNDDG
jgi:hypothetical protein